MYQSAFATYDNRTVHERWCDTMISHSTRPIRTVKQQPKKRGISQNDFSNYELKKLLTK